MDKITGFWPNDGTFFMFFYVFGCAELKKSKIKKMIRRESIENCKKLKKKLKKYHFFDIISINIDVTKK